MWITVCITPARSLALIPGKTIAITTDLLKRNNNIRKIIYLEAKI
jgi:hypothetical protein